MKPTLAQLIAQKEGTTVEFKRTVHDASKIARTIAAFANTAGGYLVVGVEDDKKIVGVGSELTEVTKVVHASEELIDPPLAVSYRAERTDGKQVLVFRVNESDQKPHKVLNHAGVLEVYIRAKDKTVPASKRMANFLVAKTEADQALLMQAPVKNLLQYLQKNERITADKYAKLVNISVYRAQKLLQQLVSQGVLLLLDKQQPKAFCLKK